MGSWLHEAEQAIVTAEQRGRRPAAAPERVPPPPPPPLPGRSRTIEAGDGLYVRLESDGSVKVIAANRQQGPQQAYVLPADSWLAGALRRAAEAESGAQ